MQTATNKISNDEVTSRGEGWQIAPVRKRGGQPGNRNRWKHGRYSKASIARRARITAVLAPLLARARVVLAMAEREIAFRDGFARTLRAEAERSARIALHE